jgi:general secretion pathway protein L
MTLQDLLNADVNSIGPAIRRGLAWWGRELNELLPPSLRERRRRTAKWLAQMSGDGVIRLWRDGVPAGETEAVQVAVRPADLIAPDGAVLVHELDLPRLSGADLHRLMALNMDRYTPFTADLVYFDTVVIDRPADSAKQRVRLGVLSRDRGRALLDRASAAGLKVLRLGVGVGPEARTLEFDFMRAIRLEEGGDPTSRRRTYLWFTCAALVAINVAIAVGRDMNDVGQLQRLVDAQQPTVILAMRLRKTVESERGRRLALLTQRSVHEPLRILDAATRALPAGAWVQRLEWNGRAVRLVGFKPASFDVLTAVQGPALSNPRSLLSDMPPKTPSGQEPFDIMADATPRLSR